MKTKLITTLTLAAATCPAITAFANLPQLDSSQFAYKYEMINLPTAEDIDGNGKNDFIGGGNWLTLGTGADSGSCSMAISGSQALKADAGKAEDAGGVWRKMNATTGADGGTGYTVEVRLKVTESTGSKGALLLNASTGDSGVNSWLVFKTDQISWGHNKNVTVLTNMNATTWHNYRIVREPGTTVHSVWIDGILVHNNLSSGIDASVNRLFLGAANGDYAGKANVAWLRFHKGAYAPVDQKAVEKASRLDSAEFDTKYEMTADDTRISTSGNASDWTISGTSGVTITKENGVLSVTPQQGKQPYWRTTDAAWKDLVTEDTAYTVEFSTKINSCTISDDRTLQFWVATPRATGNIIIGESHVYWQISSSMGDNILLDSSDNTDKEHKFRISYDGATRHGFTVWRDNVKIGENLVDLTAYNGASCSFVRFGIPGSTSGGAFDIGYIRWKIGGVYPPDTRKGLMAIVR